jgi:hypothetical protein
MDPSPCLFEPLEQSNVSPGIRAHPMILGETLGILLDLCPRERTLAALRLPDEILSLRMQEKYGGRDLVAFLQH